MANDYQPRHVGSRSGIDRLRLKVGVLWVGPVAVVAAAVWLVTTPPRNHAIPPVPNQATGRLFDANATGPTSTAAPSAASRSSAATSTAGSSAGSTAKSSAPSASSSLASPTSPSSAATGSAPSPAAGPVGYVQPTAVWTSYACVANGFAWDVTYTVRFSGGSGWETLEGAATRTEHWGVPPRGPGLIGVPEFNISVAQIWDTATNQGRFVSLANPITIHCPARG